MTRLILHFPSSQLLLSLLIALDILLSSSCLPHALVDSLFNDFLPSNFPDTLFVFTDGSVFSNSAGFSYYRLPPFS